jgi:hypothetical protein
MLIVFEKSLLNRILPLLMFFLIIGAYFNNQFWYYKTIPYYKNFIDFSLGSKSWEEYLDFWGVRRNYEVGKYLKLRTDSTDNIYVWGTEPSIYVLTYLLPVGKYTVAYHVVDFNAFDETMTALQEKPPKFVIIYPEAPEFSRLKTFVSSRYVKEIEIENVEVHRRLD